MPDPSITEARLKPKASATCHVCGRRVRTTNPGGGDGSADVFIRHSRVAGNKWHDRMCTGGRQEVRRGE